MFHKTRPSILGGCTAFIASALFLAFVVWVCCLSWRASSFSTTTGTISKKAVGYKESNQGKKYYPLLTYTYRVQETDRINSVYSFFGISGSKSWAQDIVDRTEIGANCVVYFNPNNPNESVLDPHPSTFLVGGTLVAFAIALALIVAGLRQIVIGMNGAHGRWVWN